VYRGSWVEVPHWELTLSSPMSLQWHHLSALILEFPIANFLLSINNEKTNKRNLKHIKKKQLRKLLTALSHV